MQWKRLVITSGAFLALSAALGALTAPIFREAERQATRHACLEKPAKTAPARPALARNG